MTNRASITRSAIDPAAVVSAVASPGHGATVLFVGTVRDLNDGREVEGLDYSAYEAMAHDELDRIVGEAHARHPGTAVVAIHRIGALALGDVAIAIAAAHAHRAEAFDAARYVIEEVKQRVPIWKREHYRDGSREWVAGTGIQAGHDVAPA